MNIHAIQVKTGGEDYFVHCFSCKNADKHFGYKFHFPKRKLTERFSGKTSMVEKPVFPGYLFVEADEIDIWLFKNVYGFIRFLNSNEDIKSLSGNDLQTVNHFIRHTGISKVTFDENKRIVVLEGALKGLEGQIVKVDKRKGRAKVKLDLYDDSFTIDLAFEAIGTA